jgi:hypothetical protein
MNKISTAIYKQQESSRVSLCAQELNKVWNIQIAKVIWDTLKEAHVGTDHVRQGKIDLIHGELELFVVKDRQTMRQMYDRLMLLVSDIRSLGSNDWEDSKGAFDVGRKGGSACEPGRGQPWPGPTRPPDLV